MEYLKIDNLEEYLAFSRKLSSLNDEIRDTEETFLEKLKRLLFKTPTKKDLLLTEYNRIKNIFDQNSKVERLAYDEAGAKKTAEMVRKYGWTYDYIGAYDCDGKFAYAPGFIKNPKG